MSTSVIWVVVGLLLLSVAGTYVLRPYRRYVLVWHAYAIFECVFVAGTYLFLISLVVWGGQALFHGGWR